MYKLVVEFIDGTKKIFDVKEWEANDGCLIVYFDNYDLYMPFKNIKEWVAYRTEDVPPLKCGGVDTVPSVVPVESTVQFVEADIL